MNTILALSLAALAGSKLDPALQAQVEARLPIARAWASDPVVVEAVKEANRSARTLNEIERIDIEWQGATGVSPFMRTLIDHPAAVRLRELRAEHRELQEAFVTDRLGANVAMTNKTSDFYQGDEEKFREAFAEGKGGTHIGKLALDESIQSYSIPVAVPVMDHGSAIGVLVVTVNVEKLKR
jgi:hypothetical protein